MALASAALLSEEAIGLKPLGRKGFRAKPGQRFQTTSFSNLRTAGSQGYKPFQNSGTPKTASKVSHDRSETIPAESRERNLIPAISRDSPAKSKITPGGVINKVQKLSNGPLGSIAGFGLNAATTYGMIAASTHANMQMQKQVLDFKANMFGTGIDTLEQQGVPLAGLFSQPNQMFFGTGGFQNGYTTTGITPYSMGYFGKKYGRNPMGVQNKQNLAKSDPKEDGLVSASTTHIGTEEVTHTVNQPPAKSTSDPDLEMPAAPSQDSGPMLHSGTKPIPMGTKQKTMKTKKPPESNPEDIMNSSADIYRTPTDAEAFDDRIRYGPSIPPTKGFGSSQTVTNQSMTTPSVLTNPAPDMVVGPTSLNTSPTAPSETVTRNSLLV